MKKSLFVLLVVAIVFTAPLVQAFPQCETGFGNGLAPFCTDAGRTKVCPGDANCAFNKLTIKGKQVTVISLNGWEGANENGQGDVTVFDCAGYWATITYSTSGPTNQPIQFRVCGLGQNIDNCVEPAHFHTACGSDSGLSNNNTWDSRNRSGVPCNVPDDYMGVLDTDACAPFSEYPAMDGLSQFSCDGGPFGSIYDDPIARVDCSGS